MQEAYLFVPNTPDTPLLDERFMGDVFSRIQYIEHLRLRGFKFHILSHSFGIVLPGIQYVQLSNFIIKPIIIIYLQIITFSNYRELSVNEHIQQQQQHIQQQHIQQHQQHEYELQMRYVFMTWFDEVKSLRDVNRTRVCSTKQRKDRRKSALAILRSFNKQLYLVCFPIVVSTTGYR